MAVVLEPRRVAVELAGRVESESSFLEPLLADRLGRLSAARDEDRGLLTELVYGTIRHRNRLDWIIDHTYRGDPSSMEPGLRNILRVAFYQLSCMDRVPTYAAVNEAVKQAKESFPGREGLVNAILRNFLRKKNGVSFPEFRTDPVGHLTWYHSHPPWIVERWIDRFGAEEARELCVANNMPPPLVLRVNRLKASPGDAVEALSRQGLRAAEARWSPDGLVLERGERGGLPARRIKFVEEGFLQVQDEASQLVSHLLDPRPGERLLDICSGAGIKATHLAALMGNRGAVVAVDRNRRKLELGRIRAEAMGVSIIEHIHADALEIPLDEFREGFDRILVDAPCSGLGTIRRRPEIKWLAGEDKVAELALLQGELLRHSAGMLKPGGAMLYATCTTTVEENELVVREFLKKNPSFRIGEPPFIGDELIDEEGFFRTFPHRHGTDGFFAALLVKVS